MASHSVTSGVRILQPESGRSPQGRAVATRLISFLSPLLILLVWEICADFRLIDTRLFSAPSMVVKSLIPLIASGELLHHTAISVGRICLGFLIGAGLGVILGLSMGLFPWVRAALEPMVAATFPIPKLAIMPLILLVFGLGETSKIVIIAIGVFYLVLINTMTGVLSVDKIYMDVAKSFGASRFDFYRTVALPGALPMIFAGFKLGMGTALLLIVAAELSAARAGIGYMIWRAYDMFDIERMFVGLIDMSVLGYLLSYGLDYLERLVIPWKSGR
jgi:NitT/TauT family transport system permease protein